VKDTKRKIIKKAKENPSLKTSHLLNKWALETLTPAEKSKAMLRWSMVDTKEDTEVKEQGF
jgi:hypothetical protein